MHSHVRWDFVWQRPQQLFSRFARDRDILFVEEPRFLDARPRPKLERSVPQDRLQRIVPHLPARYRESEAATHFAVRSLLHALLAPHGTFSGRFTHAIQWFHTPVRAPVMLGAFRESLVVYDHMDEMVPFGFDRDVLMPRERYLLAHTDIVFSSSHGLAGAHGTCWETMTNEMSHQIDEALRHREFRLWRQREMRALLPEVSTG